MEQAHLTENFHLGFDAYHLLQLLTNRFLIQTNGKQPSSFGLQKGVKQTSS